MANYNQILDSEILEGAPIDSYLLSKVKNNDDYFNTNLTQTKTDISTNTSAISTLQTLVNSNQTAMNSRVVSLETLMASVDLLNEVVLTASVTFDLSHRNKMVAYNSTSAGTFTIPLNSVVAFPIGTQISVVQLGTGTLTIAGASGVTITKEVGLNLNAQYAMASLYKSGTDTWRITGSLKA